MTGPTISDVQAAYVAQHGHEEAAAEFDEWLHQVTAQVADGVAGCSAASTATEQCGLPFEHGAHMGQRIVYGDGEPMRQFPILCFGRSEQSDPRDWVGTDTTVIARTTDGAEWGRGTAVAYTDRPTLTIQREDGTRFSWIADLCTPAPGRHLEEKTP